MTPTTTNSIQVPQNLRVHFQVTAGGIDAVALSVPAYSKYTPEFLSVCRSLRPSMSPATHYRSFVDLTALGVPLTWYQGQWRSHRDKLVLHQVGHMSGMQIYTLLAEIVEANPLDLPVNRVDLCADVPGVTVDWFRAHMTVKHKRRHTAIAHRVSDKLREPDKAYNSFSYETLYHGKKNLYRVYDKVAQLEELARHREINGLDLQLLNLYKTSGRPWTRVERQLLGRIPIKSIPWASCFRTPTASILLTAWSCFPAGSNCPGRRITNSPTTSRALASASTSKIMGFRSSVPGSTAPVDTP